MRALGPIITLVGRLVLQLAGKLTGISFDETRKHESKIHFWATSVWQTTRGLFSHSLRSYFARPTFVKELLRKGDSRVLSAVSGSQKNTSKCILTNKVPVLRAQRDSIMNGSVLSKNAPHYPPVRKCMPWEAVLVRIRKMSSNMQYPTCTYIKRHDGSMEISNWRVRTMPPSTTS